MLHLKKDLFARLVISSHKDRALNKTFRVVHAEASSIHSTSPTKKTDISLEESSGMERAIANSPITKSTVIKAVPKIPAAEKIDERVSRIIDDPKLLEIKSELEFAIELLRRIKSVDKNNKKIPVIEANISKLKAMLDQKMYV